LNRLKLVACAIAAALALLAEDVQAQQVPIPQTASEVPGPALGAMTPAYIQMVGRMATFGDGRSSTFTTSGPSSRRFPKP